jgi:hypothetical protein
MLPRNFTQGARSWEHHVFLNQWTTISSQDRLCSVDLFEYYGIVDDDVEYELMNMKNFVIAWRFRYAVSKRMIFSTEEKHGTRN